jgi:uncharacterized protein YgiB involved in biofilm formation
MDSKPGRRTLLLWGALLLVVAAGNIWASKVKDQRIEIYSSVDACQAEHPAEDCAKGFAGAEQEHANSAPRFIARDLCEAQYSGSCAALHDGTADWFVPAMVGFMLGHALGTDGAASVVSQPVYVDTGGTAYSRASPMGSYWSRCAVNPDHPHCRDGRGFGSGGGFVYASSGGGRGSPSSSVWTSKGYTVESVRTSVARGGFGSSASSAPSFSSRVASAPYASSSSSVTRGGFGITAFLHGVGA